MNESALDKLLRLHLLVAPAFNSSYIYRKRGVTTSDDQAKPGITETIRTPSKALQKGFTEVLPAFTKCKQRRADVDGILEREERHVG